MKIAFFGSSEFSLPFLEILHASRRHRLVTVVTTPAQKKGRGLKLEPTVIGKRAESLGIEVLAPEKLKDESAQAALRSKAPDLLVVASYGKILPGAILGIPKLLPLNVHPSLLPKYRGAAPIPWQILNGEEKTGITFFKMNEKMDAGEIVHQIELSLAGRETTGSLTRRLSEEGARALPKLLDEIEEGKASLKLQDEAQATLAPKLTKEDGEIHWNESATQIDRKIRAFDPWPSAYTVFKGETLKILAGEPADVACAEADPGVILEIDRQGFLRVQTGARGALLIREVQWAGRKRMKAYDFALGARLKEGMPLTTGGHTV